MVLGKLSLPGRLILIWIIIGQGPPALAVVGAGGCCLDIFLSRLSFLSFSISQGNGPI